MFTGNSTKIYDKNSVKILFFIYQNISMTLLHIFIDQFFCLLLLLHTNAILLKPFGKAILLRQ